jgi:hypothetical protein
MGVPTAQGGDLPRNTPATLDPVAALRLELLQMMHDMQTGMMAQMAAHLGNNCGPAQGDMNTNVRSSAYQRLEDSLQPNLPFDQAIRGGDSHWGFEQRKLTVLSC